MAASQGLRLQLKMHQDASLAPSLAEQVYEHVKAGLFDLALLPGDHFTESDVVSALGVSRTPVRQALQQLAREGFVRVSQRHGWQVCPFDFDRFEQLYDVRIILELAAVERLCQQPSLGTNSLLQELDSIWSVTPEQRLPASREVALLDEEFHCRLVEATGNQELGAMHRDVTDKISIVRRLDFTKQNRVAATYAEHAAILQAILERRGDAAKCLLRTHIEASKAEVRKITIHHLQSARKIGLGQLAWSRWLTE